MPFSLDGISTVLKEKLIVSKYKFVPSLLINYDIFNQSSLDEYYEQIDGMWLLEPDI